MENKNKETKNELLKLAKRRVRLRKGVEWHAIIYLIVNAFLCAIYYLTTPNGYFWPIWAIVGWGLGLVIHFVVIRSSLASAREDRELIKREYKMLQEDFEQDDD